MSAKKAGYSAKPKADIDFEAELWEVANELRGESATLEEFKTNNYILTPGRYVGTEAEEDDGIPFKEKMKGLVLKLNEQFAKSFEPEKTISENLKNLGYGS